MPGLFRSPTGLFIGGQLIALHRNGETVVCGRGRGRGRGRVQLRIRSEIQIQILFLLLFLFCFWLIFRTV